VIEYKVKILVRQTGLPVNNIWYNEFGAKVWIDRLAKKYGYQASDLMISDVHKVERIWS
jgi:hypothetical protein